jgi:hypothetical protein
MAESPPGFRIPGRAAPLDFTHDSVPVHHGISGGQSRISSGLPLNAGSSVGIVGVLMAQVTANMLWNSAEADPQYSTLWMLPLSVDRIYRYLKHRVLWSAAWVSVEFLVLYLLVPSSNTVLSVVGAFLQGLVLIAFALLIVKLSVRFERLVVALWLLPFMIGFGLLVQSATLHQLATKLLYVCHPFGWVNVLYVEGWVRGNPQAWWALVPIAALLAAIPRCLRMLRRLNAEGAFRITRTLSRRAKQRPSSKPVNEAMRPGLIERLLTRFLSPHEQIVLETLLIDRPRWSKEFYAVLLYAAAFLAANTFIHFHSLVDLGRAAIVNFNDRVAQSVAGSAAGAVFFPFMLFHGLRLFGWHIWPERVGLGPTTNRSAINYFFVTISLCFDCCP